MEDYVVRCGNFVDGTGRPPRKDIRLLIRRGRIARITDGTALDDCPHMLDVSDKTVMPGLVDAHKHIINCGGSGVGVGLDLAQAAENIRQVYQGGVTSVLDLGSGDMLRFVPQMDIPQPRIFYALTILTCTGGYPREYMPSEFYALGAVEECADKASIRAAVSRLRAKGVSAIKTAVVSRTFDGRPAPCWTDELLRFLTDEAHSYGLKVCAHITYAADYARAIRCGVDSMHHAAFDAPMRKEDREAMAEQGSVFVPTLSLMDLMLAGLRDRWIDDPAWHPAVNRTIMDNMRRFTAAYECGADDEPVGELFIRMPRRDLRRVPRIQLNNARAWVEQGGIMAMGTDSALGFSLHTTPVRELELLVEAGLSPLEAVKASTLTAASVFGREKEIGSLETGKKADMLVVDGDVAQDVGALRRIERVIIDGKTMCCRSEKTEPQPCPR